MTTSLRRTAVITALKSKAHLVREVWSELGYTYEETLVPGRDDLVNFTFKQLDDAATRRLVAAVPREAYAYRATVNLPPGSPDS